MLAAPPSASGIALRAYQREAVEAFHAATERGLRRVLVQLATGLGKTLVFSALAHETVARGGRVLVIAHRDELLTQARDKLLMADPSADVGIVRAGLDDAGARIVVASIQTIVRPARLARLGRFDLIVIDECHHAAAESYRLVLESLGAFGAGGPLVLGVTATPGRGDGQGLDGIFEEIVYRMSMLDGIRQGYLSDVRAVRIAIDTDFSGVRSRGGDFAENELAAELLAADAPEHVARAYTDHARGRRALVFTPTIALAQMMAAALNGAGVSAAWVSGETPQDERRAILADFRDGHISAIANAMLLTEGFDCPPVDCIITARPTKSTALYTQMIGRGTRLHPGKRDCLVLDVVGQVGRHDLMTAASLFGVADHRLTNSTVLEAYEQQEREQAAETNAVVARGRMVAEAVDIFRRRPLHWVQASPERYVLAVRGGRITLDLGLRGWTAAHVPQIGATAVLGRNLPLEYAQGVAEDRARLLGADFLANRDAPWRQRPASDKQIQVLRRRGVHVSADLTAGEASDLITAGRQGA